MKFNVYYCKQQKILAASTETKARCNLW